MLFKRHPEKRKEINRKLRKRWKNDPEYRERLKNYMKKYW
jgi:hypothetical protein